ncbi:MAG: hypothetical protein MZW92_03255 [Comamonadaceae bacterium]|nr:hypothetical protein [Comamonadaceae bacterium]
MTLAMVRIIQAVFGTSGVTALAICLGLTVLYTTLSGLWGVVATDMLLFGVAMAGSIILSVVSVEQAGGHRGAGRRGQGGGRGEQARTTSRSSLRCGQALPLAFFVARVRPVVGGLLPRRRSRAAAAGAPRRMLAAKDPRHAVKGTLWFTVANYVAAAVALDPDGPGGHRRLPGPDGSDAGRDGSGLPADDRLRAERRRRHHHRVAASRRSCRDRVHRQPGRFCILLNDLYRPFVRKDASEKHYKSRSSRVMVLVVSRCSGPAFSDRPGERQDGLAAGHGALGRDRPGAAAALVLVARSTPGRRSRPSARRRGRRSYLKTRAGQPGRARARAGARAGRVRRRTRGASGSWSSWR